MAIPLRLKDGYVEADNPNKEIVKPLSGET